MEASHKTHRPHIKVGKDKEKKKKTNLQNHNQARASERSRSMNAKKEGKRLLETTKIEY